MLVSVGGSSMKVWTPGEWWCVASTDITQDAARLAAPQGLPPGDAVYSTDDTSLALPGSGSLSAVGSSMYFGAHSTRASVSDDAGSEYELPGAAGHQQLTGASSVVPGVGDHRALLPAQWDAGVHGAGSVVELPSAVMDDVHNDAGEPLLSSPSWASSALDGPSVLGNRLSSQLPGTHLPPDVRSTRLLQRGVPPHFVRPTAALTVAVESRDDGVESPSAPAAGTLSLLTGHVTNARQLRRGHYPPASVSCAALLEVKGRTQTEGHDIVVCFGDGSMQFYSVFDWKFLYRIPAHRVPFGRHRACAVTCVVQLQELAARMLTGYL